VSAGEFVIALAVRLDDVDEGQDDILEHLRQIAGGMVAGTEALAQVSWVRIDQKLDRATPFDATVTAGSWRTLDARTPDRWPHVLEQAS
jgi:hypothetical protein